MPKIDYDYIEYVDEEFDDNQLEIFISTKLPKEHNPIYANNFA